MESKKPIVLVVTGGKWQLHLIKKLQAQGYAVLNINLYSYTEGARQADFFEQSDVVDKEKCLQLARKYELCGVVTDQSDIAVTTVAYIAHELNLPGIKIEHAELFTHKLLMKERAQQLGILCPAFAKVRDEIDIIDFAAKYGYPLVLKPVACQGSRGVVIVRSAAEVSSVLTQTLGYQPAGQPCIVEQFIDGVEWTVEGFKGLDRHRSLAVSQKEHFISNPMVSSSILYEPVEHYGKHKELLQQNDKLVEGLGLSFGITHAEYMYSNGKFYLVEVAARGGGSNISSHVIPAVSGIDVTGLLIDCITGKKVNAPEPSSTHDYVLLAYMDFKQGKVIEMTSLESLESLPGVIDFEFNFQEGEHINKMVDDSTRHAQVIVSGSSAADVWSKFQNVKQSVQISYE